jgi:3-keto-disaccharide hydrolase
MKKSAGIAAGTLAVAAALFGCAGQYGEGWTTLDTTSLASWGRVGDANWRVEDGMLVADRGNGFLVTSQSFGDFQLVAEFYVDPESNSGIFIRCEDPTKPGAKVCYEVNIWDRRPVQKYGTGAIVDVAEVNPMPHAGGQWNTYEITAKGDQFFVTLNGQRTVDGVRNGAHARGAIALQRGPGQKTDKEGVVKFRKVQIRAL